MCSVKRHRNSPHDTMNIEHGVLTHPLLPQHTEDRAVLTAHYQLSPPTAIIIMAEIFSIYSFHPKCFHHLTIIYFSLFIHIYTSSHHKSIPILSLALF